jgi:ribosomal protein L11 methyltransferase
VIRLAVRVARDQADVALAELLELAPAGVEEVELQDGRVEYAVYGPPGELPALPELHALAGGAPVEISTTEVADDWPQRWREFHRPVRVEPPRSGAVPALRVRPPWEPAAATENGQSPAIELVIDPGQAFGTGAHASTRLCLELLLELRAPAPPPAAVLDVGTGSGVLAIAAAKLGYVPLLALDNEGESVEAAGENAGVNGVAIETRRFDLRREPLPWLGPGAGERPEIPGAGPVIVLANLLAPLLATLSRAIERPPSHLIAGGLLVEQLDESAAVFAANNGLCERARRCAEGWGALLLGAG